MYSNEKVPPEPPPLEYRIRGEAVFPVPGKVRETAFEVLFEQDNDQTSLPNLILDSILKVCCCFFVRSYVQSLVKVECKMMQSFLSVWRRYKKAVSRKSFPGWR
jgi:hypothetical protein